MIDYQVIGEEVERRRDGSISRIVTKHRAGGKRFRVIATVNPRGRVDVSGFSAIDSHGNPVHRTGDTSVYSSTENRITVDYEESMKLIRRALTYLHDHDEYDLDVRRIEWFGRTTDEIVEDAIHSR